MTTMQELDVLHCPLDGINLIEASAGTGKTWNICGLYLRLLLERGLSVQQILVVTFTNAATAELRERIRQRLVDTLRYVEGDTALAADTLIAPLVNRLRKGPESAATLHGALKLALATFDEAAIFTIHGFCQRALADTPFTAHMPLQLELLRDDSELVTQAVNDFWRKHLAHGNVSPALAAYLTGCKDSPEKFTRLVKRQLGKPLSVNLWPAAIDQPAQGDDAALQDAFEAARAQWQHGRSAALRLVTDALPGLNAVSYKADGIAAAAAEWDQLFCGPNALPWLEKMPTKAALLSAVRLTKGTKKGCKTPEHAFFASAQLVLDAVASGVQDLKLARLRLLRALLEEATDALRQSKRQRGIIAFDDMLFNLYERLTGDTSAWLVAALRSRFPAALVDEFQDTDPLQFAIFKSIYGAGNTPLFLVGDPKQAIYSFRNADLNTYLRAREQAQAEYTLAANQRSIAPLISALNQFFGTNPQAFILEGLQYREVKAGAKARKTLHDDSVPVPLPPLQIWQLPAPDAAGAVTAPPLLKANVRLAVAQATAAEVARLLRAAQDGRLHLDQKPVRAGDIAVLVRTNAEGSLMRSALSALRIGCVELSQTSIYQTQDAEDLDRLLCAILEPARAQRLFAALATELMGADAQRIEALQSAPQEQLAIVQRFSDWRQLWHTQGIGVMLRHWLSDEGVAQRLLRRPDGERRMTNVLHLFECLHQAEQEHHAADALLHWFQTQRQDSRSDETTQLRLESDQNLVQIVTIHRSKGLEYPFVFCPFLWNGRINGLADDLDGVQYHDPQGANVVDFRAAFDDEFDKDYVSAQRQRDQAAEFLRLVYVALTRAVHRCYLVAGCYLTRAGTSVTPNESIRSLLNWLVAGAQLSAAQWFAGKSCTVADIDHAWQALAARSDGTIGLCKLPTIAAVPLDTRPPGADPLMALAPPALRPLGWWIGSYSGMVHGALHDQAGVDHDLRAGATPTLNAEALLDQHGVDADDILRFPRGPLAGQCMHTAFEKADFNDNGTWAQATDLALRQYRVTSHSDAPALDASTTPDDELQPRMLLRMLDQVLHTPIPLPDCAPLQLDQIALQKRLTELEFHMPVPQLDARTLQQRLHQWGYPVAPLAVSGLRGYLKGFIDLVIEHEGRFYVLDWKSNYLGPTANHYAPQALDRAMGEHSYHLQYLMYSVALQRYLQQRLPGYSAASHFGGVLYLFVRGVRPGWVAPDGRPCGVFFHRPPDAVLEQLSELLDTPAYATVAAQTTRTLPHNTP